MPDLAFHVDGAETTRFAASPELAVSLSITNGTSEERIHGILLRCQVRIEAPRRAYTSVEVEKLADVFGPSAQWGRSLKSLLWTQVSVAVPAFEDRVTVELPLPCSYDFALTTTKYLHALHGHEVPLAFLFSGTLFHASVDAEVRAAPIPWTNEVRYPLPHRVYAETIAHYYPCGVPLPLRRDVFDRLLRFRTENGLATWERTIEALLPTEGESPGPGGKAG
jgi:hypothetical protein